MQKGKMDIVRLVGNQAWGWAGCPRSAAGFRDAAASFK